MIHISWMQKENSKERAGGVSGETEMPEGRCKARQGVCVRARATGEMQGCAESREARLALQLKRPQIAK